VAYSWTVCFVFWYGFFLLGRLTLLRQPLDQVLAEYCFESRHTVGEIQIVARKWGGVSLLMPSPMKAILAVG